MNKELNVGVCVTVSGRWPTALPEKRLREYGQWLEESFPGTRMLRFPRLLCGAGDLDECCGYFRENRADIIVLIYGAFTGDAVPCGLADACACPVVLFAPREERWERDDRLYANALCSAAMNGASLKRIHAPHFTVFGDKEEPRVKKELEDIFAAQRVLKNLRGMTFGLFGYRPTAFYNCAFDENVIRRTFGIGFEETDLKVVFDTMDALPREEVEAQMREIQERWDTRNLPEGHLENHARLYLALKKLVPEYGYDFCSIKCWPEMGALHTTPCAVLGRLMDEGVGIACEGDVDAGITAAVQRLICGEAPFITDLIDIDEKENTVAFWHCGNAAPSLHDAADGIEMRNHPLAGQGTSFWCALKPGPVTAARFTNFDGQYKLFLLRGTAVPTVRRTRGCMVDVKVDTPVLELIRRISENGMSHHYSLVWRDIAGSLRNVAGLLGIPVVEL